MSPLFGHLVGVMILLLMVVFIGIWIWAWRSRHKPTFDALAAIPMREDPGGAADAREARMNRGKTP